MIIASVAQWLEHRSYKAVVEGSTPSRSTERRSNMNLFVVCLFVGLILGFCIGILFTVFFTHHFDADDSEEYNDIWKG